MLKKNYQTLSKKEVEMGRACTTNGEGKECIEDSGGKARRKETLGRPRHKWVDSIKMDLRMTGWGSMDWTYLAHDRDQWRPSVNMAMNFQVS
jgi:hypothetical protein